MVNMLDERMLSLNEAIKALEESEREKQEAEEKNK